jgi:hypothetical protein
VCINILLQAMWGQGLLKAVHAEQVVSLASSMLPALLL